MAYKVAVLMGSPNDGEKMAPVAATLERYGIEADVRVMSAHRSPALVSAFVAGARADGYSAIICGAGMAAHLAGAAAAHTTLPVDGAMNAALLVVQMLAISDPALVEALVEHRAEMVPR